MLSTGLFGHSPRPLRTCRPATGGVRDGGGRPGRPACRGPRLVVVLGHELLHALAELIDSRVHGVAPRRSAVPTCWRRSSRSSVRATRSLCSASRSAWATLSFHSWPSPGSRGPSPWPPVAGGRIRLPVVAIPCGPCPEPGWWSADPVPAWEPCSRGPLSTADRRDWLARTAPHAEAQHQGHEPRTSRRGTDVPDSSEPGTSKLLDGFSRRAARYLPRLAFLDWRKIARGSSTGTADRDGADSL